MPETFLMYLRKEQARLELALSDALAAEQRDHIGIASLRQQLNIVDDQLTKWTADLQHDQMAA